MEPRRIERRLAAILAADMAGYSRLMEADEAGTHARFMTHRLELIDPAVAKATHCAIEIQAEMMKRNEGVPPARWMQFRIGINLGDVIDEDGDIFGDGVNI